MTAARKNGAEEMCCADERAGGRRAPLLICASTQYWHEAWFRKQHFMQRLSTRYPVLYVEPSFSIVRRVPPRCPDGHANARLRADLHHEAENLWTLRPPRGLPLWTHPLVSRVQYGMWGRMLRRTAGRVDGVIRAGAAGGARLSVRDGKAHRPVWLWLYNPLYIQARGTLRSERVIFDLVDDLEAYEGRAHSRSTMRACMERALREADLVFTTSPLLAEKFAAMTREGRMHVVPNGVRGEWIARRGAVPSRLRDLPRPWIGFMGAVFRYLDYDLLVATARAFPQATLVMVGPIEDQAGAARLAAEPNVRLLGRCSQDHVPDYVGAFDVCLSPFKAGAVRRAVNPLKIYEYLAAGRPVVSTPLDSLASEPVARWIRFAEGRDAFVRAIGESLAERDATALCAARREAVRPYAWEALAERVAETLGAAEERWAREGVDAGAGLRARGRSSAGRGKGGRP